MKAVRIDTLEAFTGYVEQTFNGPGEVLAAQRALRPRAAADLVGLDGARAAPWASDLSARLVLDAAKAMSAYQCHPLA
jgi:hypothetical protein